MYLDAAPFPRMPNGQNNEWRTFWDDGNPELEARNGPPLLWWCLFGADDLRTARRIDDLDAGDSHDPDRAGDGVPADATYPYLVTAQDRASRRLAQRRGAVLAGIGSEHAGTYDAFAALIEQRFGPFVLLRTADLPDVAGAEPELRRVAAGMDALDADPAAPPAPAVEALFAEFRRRRAHDPALLLGGSGARGAWPPAVPPSSRTAGAPGTAAVPGPGGGAAPGRDGAVRWLAATLLAAGGAAAWTWGGSMAAGLSALGLAVALAARPLWRPGRR